MAKARIGHFVEARVLAELGVDFIDESEVLTPADEEHHIDKGDFRVPFVCGATNLGEALRRIGEGAALLRTKGEAGTGDVVEAVRHLRRIAREIRELGVAPRAERMAIAKGLGAPYELVCRVADEGRLPVPNFAAGGVAGPADAALVMQLGAEAVFVGSGVFKSDDPARTAAAIVKATARHADFAVVAEACAETGAPMRGSSAARLDPNERLAGARLVSEPPSCQSGISTGVLALQGDSAPHMTILRALGCTPRAVRTSRDLEGLTHLVLPGGESTTLAHLIDLFALREPLRQRHRAGQLTIFGTCAGAILLAPRRHRATPAPATLGRPRATQRLRSPGRLVHTPDRCPDAGPGSPPRRLHPRPPRPRRGPRRRSPRPLRRRPDPGPRPRRPGQYVSPRADRRRPHPPRVPAAAPRVDGATRTATVASPTAES